MDVTKQQDQVWPINPARLPRHRYFQKRLSDIRPRMRRIIVSERKGREKVCQNQMDAIDSRIDDTSKTPTIRLVMYGDVIRTQHSLLKNLSNGAGAGPQSDDLGRVLVIWMTAIRDKKKFEDILTREVIPRLKKCYSMETVTPVVLCIEHGGLPSEKESFKEDIVKRINKTKEFKTGFDTEKQLVIVNTSVDHDAKEVVKTMHKSPSPSRRMGRTSGNVKRSPPKIPEKVHSPMETDSASVSTGEPMDVDPVPNMGPITRSKSTYTSLNETKVNDSETKAFAGQLAPGAQLATDASSKESDLKRSHSSRETKQPKSPSKRSCTDAHAVADEADIADEAAAVAELLDAISYQLETTHIHTLGMIETLVNKVNNKRAGDEDVTNTMDKLLFEVNGVFYQSITKEGARRKSEAEKKRLSEKLTGDLLSVQHVYGCGRMYGKLHVHIDKTDDESSVRERIEQVLKQHKYKYNFEMRPVLEKPTHFERTSIVICSA